MRNYSLTRVTAAMQRLYDGKHVGLYLITIDTGCKSRRVFDDDRYPDHIAQSYGIMDDFGDIVFVKSWL